MLKCEIINCGVVSLFHFKPKEQKRPNTSDLSSRSYSVPAVIREHGDEDVADDTQKGLINRNICSLGFYIFHFILFSVENLLHSHEIRRGFSNNVVTRVCV